MLDSSKDMSVGSDDLLAYNCDPRLSRLLGLQRCDLLRPVQHLLSGDILELDAECGGVTRFLGETGARVVALEADLNRMKLACTRCSGLSNVSIIGANFKGFHFSRHFKFILALGTPEGSLYTNIQRRTGDMLECAHQLLERDGYLLIGAANRLRIDRDAVTDNACLGLAEWQDSLGSRGFRIDYVLYPLPSSREPAVIFGEDIFHETRLNIISIVLNYLLPSDPLKADLIRVTNNSKATRPDMIQAMYLKSMLIVARRNDAATQQWKPQELMWIYSTKRRRHYAKEAYLVQDGEDYCIRRHRLYPYAEANCYRQTIIDEKWLDGQLYIDGLYKIAIEDRWHIEEIAAWAKPWVNYLRRHITGTREDGAFLLPRDFVDLSPFNCILLPNGEIRTFDLEYASLDPPIFEYVICRGLWHSLARLPACAVPDKIDDLRLLNLVRRTLECLGIYLPPDRWTEIQHQEAVLENAIAGIPMDLARHVAFTTKLNIRSPQIT
jgi:hypothetical protein